MNEICVCHGPGFCHKFQRTMSDRDYEICSLECPPERPCSPAFTEAYQQVWARERLAKRSLCLHMGAPDGHKVRCPTCKGHVEIKTHRCEVHGRCTPTTPVPNFPCCNTCPDFQG